MERPTVRESWLKDSSLGYSDYQALLEFLRFTPWGEDWSGERAYSRAPGLSLAELDRAWQLERWRFAYANKSRRLLPNPVLPSIVTFFALGAALQGLRAGLQGDVLALLLFCGVGLVLGAGAGFIWRGYLPYWRAKAAYQARRATLVERSGRA